MANYSSKFEIGMLLNTFLRSLRMRKALPYISEDSVVCDIGCGTKGEFLRLIHKKIKKGFGVDSDIENHAFHNIDFKNFTINQRLDFENGKFDHVSMLATLEHLEHPQEILKESYRILKDGGSLIITCPAPKSKFLLRLLVYSRLLSNFEKALEHKNYFSERQLEIILFSAGFTRVVSKTFEFGFNNFIVAYK